jgi:hypothetical protein
MVALEPQERKQLEALEESLWTAATRFDRDHMERVLAADFFEFGRSGATYDRAGILALEPSELDVLLSEMQIRLLGPDVAVITYRSELRREGETYPANRSSIWTRHDGIWQLRFHQGTPKSPD